MQSDFFSPYLNLYAEAEARAPYLQELRGETWAHCLVVPVHQEGDCFSRLLESLNELQTQSSKRFLCIFVFNERFSGPGLNLDFRARLESYFAAQIFDASFTFFRSPFLWDALIVNRATRELRFSDREGVGLARKIGCDVALRLIQVGQIQSAWIRTTDADASLAVDYFLAEDQVPNDASAFVMPFRHSLSSDAKLAASTLLYESFLNHYVEGLSQAKSPYAFHTIGSTIGVSAKSYALARGFPKILAGEDFYLLNKVAKLGKIVSLETVGKIELEGRLSARVPFGTGAALIKYSKAVELNEMKIFYQPKSFELLRSWLDALRSLAKDETLESFRQVLFEQSPKDSHQSLALFLKNSTMEADLLRLTQQAKLRERRLHHYDVYFDAFKTLKFIHFFRDHAYPSFSMKEKKEDLSWRSL